MTRFYVSKVSGITLLRISADCISDIADIRQYYSEILLMLASYLEVMLGSQLLA